MPRPSLAGLRHARSPPWTSPCSPSPTSASRNNAPLCPPTRHPKAGQDAPGADSEPGYAAPRTSATSADNPSTRHCHPATPDPSPSTTSNHSRSTPTSHETAPTCEQHTATATHPKAQAKPPTRNERHATGRGVGGTPSALRRDTLGIGPVLSPLRFHGGVERRNDLGFA